MSRKEGAPPTARFVDPEAQSIFHSLQMGTDDEFVISSETLTKRLIARMNAATTKGLLACVRADDESGRIGAVLKMEVDESNGTRIEELASGEIRLAAVTNVVKDQPGKLQKGVLVTNDKPAEEVICGDSLYTQSRYFPEAFGIQVFSKPGQGLASLMQAIANYDPRLARRAVGVLPQVTSGSVPQILAALQDRVPEFDSEAQMAIAAGLTEGTRPVTLIDPAMGVDAVIQQGGITIKGPASVLLEKLEFREVDDGQCEIAVRFDNQPRIVYKTPLARNYKQKQEGLQ